MASLPLTGTTLFLVRHGETDHNAAGRLQGHLDAPLCEKGRLQAAAAAANLRGRGIEYIYSSDLTRAHETARAIGIATGREVRLDPRLREVNVGDWAGLTAAEQAASHPAVFARLRQEPETTTYPGGESYRELAARVLAALAELATNHPGQTLAIVCHGGPLRAIMSHVLNYGWDQRDRFTFENCGILRLKLAESGPQFSVPAPGLS